MRSLFSICFSLMILGCLNGCKSEIIEQPLSDYRCEEGNFRILLPGEPSVRIKPVGVLGKVHVVEAFNPGLEYAITYGDFIHGTPTKKDFANLYQTAIDAILKDSKGTKLYSTDAMVRNYTGTEVGIRLPDQEDDLMKVKLFIVQKRFYILGVRGDRTTINSPEASRFFSSFQLLQEPKVKK